MKLYKYKSYKEYVKCQVSANKKKKSNQWACEENIKFLSEYLRMKMRQPQRGLCHGVRTGKEVDWFNKYLDKCKVIGTDIGKSKHKNVVKWDFNERNNSWFREFDFIYSNSFDHAFDPGATFLTWTHQVKRGGVIILEYDRRNEHTGEISKSINKTDPVSIKLKELIKVIPNWCHNAKVIDILDMPVVTQQWRKSVVIEVS